MIFLFLGFPSAWDKIFSLIAGLLIIAVAFRFRSQPKTSNLQMPYVEHKNDQIVRPQNLAEKTNVNTVGQEVHLDDISFNKNITSTDSPATS